MPNSRVREFRYEVVVCVAGDLPPGYQPLEEMSIMSSVLSAARSREADAEDDYLASIVGVYVKRA
jgi:hypothetical protein